MATCCDTRLGMKPALQAHMNNPDTCSDDLDVADHADAAISALEAACEALEVITATTVAAALDVAVEARLLLATATAWSSGRVDVAPC